MEGNIIQNSLERKVIPNALEGNIIQNSLQRSEIKISLDGNVIKNSLEKAIIQNSLVHNSKSIGEVHINRTHWRETDIENHMRLEAQ